MKETIEFYYSLKIDELLIEKDCYHFILDGYDYFFIYYNRSEKEFEDIYNCVIELKQKNIECHQFVVNINNLILTKIDNNNYVLLRTNNIEDVYNIIDIINMNKKTILLNPKSDMYRNNWYNLWKNKIDYIEEQLNEVKYDSIIYTSIDYYIGLAENAIRYINIINNKYAFTDNDKIVLSHKRIYYPNKKVNYLNPLSFIFDLEVRDISEYVKSCFFYSDDDAFFELKTFLNCKRLSTYSYNMLFVRLLYPSYYFDLYEQIINNNINSEKLLKIINKRNEFNEFIKKAYKEISLYAPLENIEWIIY